MYLEKFIDYFNSLQNNENQFIELELKLLIDPRNKYPNFIKSIDLKTAINKCKDLFKYFSSISDITERQTINFIKSEKDSSIIKELHFINGIQNKKDKKLYIKNRLHSPLYITLHTNNNFKLSLSSEVKTSETCDYDLIRFKQRFTFFIDEWNIDFTFLKTSTSKNTNDMKEIRDKLFVDINKKSIFEDKSWIWDYTDCIEIEFEYNSTYLSIQSIKHILDILNESISIEKENERQISPESFLQHLCYIINNNNNINSKNTIKKILPSAIEINKRQYFEEILPIIDNFYITDKADGLRTILIINDNIALYNTEYKLLEKNIYFSLGETIIECEMINDKFYAFDILKYDGVITSDKTFNERIKFLHMIANTWDNLVIKDFVQLTKDNYAQSIKSFITANKIYETDGIIFTSANASYKSTKFYKWKDVKNMTIDFLVKKCPNNLLGISPYINKEGMDLYILFSGITYNEYMKFNLNKIKYYNEIFISHIGKDYFPIQFSPSDNPMAYLFWQPNVAKLDDKIVELRVIYDNNQQFQWELVRIRDDRIDDVKKKNYYGNHFKVAELIWRNYSNPLKIEDLCTSLEDFSKNFYFKKHNSETHMSVRKFNNMVKFELLQRYADKIPPDSWVLDLGCGKGQDLFKYSTLNNVKNVLFIDNNENNLCTVIERKYKFASNIKNKNSLGIFVKNVNLLDDWETNRNIIKTSNPLLKKIKTKLIICNFALHYFVKSIDSIDNFVNLVDSFLSPGGRFIFTCLNGEKIFNILSQKSWGDGKKYLIKSCYKNNIFRGGEEIDILLPFSDTLYKEYLVNLNIIEKRFKKKKITLESQANFGDIYLEKFRETLDDFKLDDLDLNYIDLLNFSVYYKK